MDTQPKKHRKFTTNPHQQVPEDLARALRNIRSRRYPLGPALLACREAEWGVPALAAALDMKPEAVAKQIERARAAEQSESADVRQRARECRTLVGMDIPAPPLRADEHPDTGQDPGPELPAWWVRHLRDLRGVATTLRGNAPASNPARIASVHLAADIDHLLRSGYRKVRLCQALDVTYRAIDQRLERYGYREPAPTSPLRRVVSVPTFTFPH